MPGIISRAVPTSASSVAIAKAPIFGLTTTIVAPATTSKTLTNHMIVVRNESREANTVLLDPPAGVLASLPLPGALFVPSPTASAGEGSSGGAVTGLLSKGSLFLGSAE